MLRLRSLFALPATIGLALTSFSGQSLVFRRPFTLMASGDSAAFFQLRAFAVVGASEDRAKFGNKVLRCYVKHGKDVTPVNKRSLAIEGLPCVPSLAAWVSGQQEKQQHAPDALGVSIVTPPGVTKVVIEEGYRLGLRHFFLQPGTHDKETDAWLRSCDAVKDVRVVTGCVLIELGC